MNHKKRYIAHELSEAELQKALKSIGEFIKKSREAAPTTLDDLSYETRVSRSALRRLESGDDVRLSTFIKIVYGLKIKPSELFKDFK